MLMGVVDTLIIGRAGALEMAAVSLGNSVCAAIFVFGIGVGMGVEPLVGQAFGSGQHRQARAWMWQGIWLVLFLSLPLVGLTALSTEVFEPLGISKAISESTNGYIFARLLGIPFTALSAVLRSYLANVGRARPALVSVGLARSTTVCMMLICLVLAWAIWRTPVRGAREGDTTHAFQAPKVDAMTRIYRVGWPVGAQITVEVGVFTAVSALIARYGEIELAGHQIALAMASLSFMMAVGLSNATTARVGYHIGAGDSVAARRSGLLGIGIGGAFMGVCGLGFVLFADAISALFTNELQVRQMAAGLLRIAGFFAISDGVQVVSAGALRGAGETKWAFYANLAAHWLLGLPVAIMLAQWADLGPAGYWWGLTLGLTLVALTLSARYAVLSRKPLRRLEAKP
jgi:MATE family multidrug resistance protein